ncbi:MAG: hypothetical protein H6696_15340 [Deferribacteres bacterium]|nr:hypothetical protein [candidate division KSB1 bacterium]MCB9503302.1 hypothetical protein [Deferribacteres bacterium]
MKKHMFNVATLAALLIVFTGFFACENQQITSPGSSEFTVQSLAKTTSEVDVLTNDLLEAGPVSMETTDLVLLSSLPGSSLLLASDAIVTCEKDELKVVKSKKSKKLYSSQWNVPRNAKGWTYSGDDRNGKAWLYFPLESVSQDESVTIDLELDGLLRGGIEVELSPHGLQFENTVTAMISYAKFDLGTIDENKLRIWYWNENLQLWEMVKGYVDTENKLVVGSLEHFSRYAIGSE